MGVRHVVFAAGEEFAGYTIESVLGTGGMGAVYLAKHPRLPRRDALKLLNPAFSTDPSFRARFEREADLASGLVHRNIVAVYDRGAVDGQLWISMQYVAGIDASMAVHAADGSMTPQRAVHIVSEVGAGLDFAHRAGLLHRDVKPANILLAASNDPSEPEHVLLTDFGIAKSTEDEVQHLTGTGNLLATLAYASPEQIEAKDLDHRVDIYALGCVLYELLTGSVPFPESSPFATMTAHLKNPPPRPSDKVPWLPTGFDAVVAKAMAKDPNDRYNSCRELSLAARAALVAADPAISSPTRAEVAVTSSLVGNETSVDAGVVADGASRGGVASRSGVASTGGAASGDPGSGEETARGSVVAPPATPTSPRPPFTLKVRRISPALGTAEELGPVSTSYLAATHRIELEELLHEARFFSLPPRLPLKYAIPGDVLLEITVSNDEVTRTVAYEREGASHPIELDHIISLLERVASWQQIRQSTPPHGVVPSPWTPTGSVPPLGGIAVGPTQNYPPGGHTGSQNGTAAVPAGFYQTGGMGRPPQGPPGPGGMHNSGPHPTGYPQQFASSPHTGPGPAMPKQGGAKKWLLIAIAAILVIAAGTTAAVLLTQSSATVTAPATPTGLTATADGRTVTVKWNNSTGATGYTLSRSGNVVYNGVGTSFVEEKVLPGRYDYTVTASTSSGHTSAPTSAVYVTVNDPWGAEASIVDDFPDLLPKSPSDTGYDGSTCSVSSDTENSKADGIIACTDPNGLYFEVMHFTSAADKEAYLQRDWSNSPVIETWNIDGTDKGKLYRSADTEASLPYIITTFDDSSRTQYLLYVHWSDHTTTDLMDNWWRPATF